MNSIYEVLDNVELLISLCVIFEVSLFIENTDKKTRKALNMGLLSMIGILVINAPWIVVPGVHLDARVVFIGLIFLIFDETSAIVVTSVLIMYRMALGGIGTAAGVLMMATAGMIGILWKTYKVNQKIKNSWINLYLFGLVLHALVLV